ncbi:MAG TPA: cytochrome-c oxidase, cbb3-type subunit I [Lacibacter sp.]|nr:cytochrome-c oxidase, cbb3-type subunit I [Lacibacter sp.]HMO88284.1 cytochrome-c oxidase, cbb3-type subunit I [Lacibacter sp.]HMP86526.1 cytochrome-c oxidase, cbb3-type subunit I [Lacibacter sp.]
MQVERFQYDNRIVRDFALATIVWGVVGMLVGLWVALQLVFPQTLNIGPWFSFGRLRPLHTNAVIFAFVGNGIFMGVYYSLQRLLKARMFSDMLSKIHFWGWQLIIVAAAITLPLGLNTAKEYAELEWPIDIAITLIWVVFGINMFGTILKRRERHLYVAVWFYIATFITVAVLHLVNSFALPVSLFKSYSWYAGVQDALVQWWYGHNAVAFFLTTPYLGLMYYFMPKAANRPVYSYKLSIIHFWALIFLYIWAGPHHLLYTALPNWAQSLGVVFSFMLIFPSWGGMINGLLTLRGAWDKVREDVILKFMVVAVTAYGMATFEGPMLSLKTINAISHFTDWTIAHVHVGGLGWNGMLTFGILYWLIPRIFRTELFSKKLANFHFWIGTLGIVFWAVPMYWAGWTQASMWKQFTESGQLKYQFLETVTYLQPFYAIRALGGLMFLTGAIVMMYNLFKTIGRGNLLAQEDAEAPALEGEYQQHKGEHWHRWIERKPWPMLVTALIVILIGGVVEMVPTFLIKENVPTISSVKPYTPLELQGRDLYIREGCYVCHSQMVRPFRSETERYGEYSKAGEFVYDHPFQWGSKRTGPDLAREGTGNNKKSHSWHYNHFDEPQAISTGSVMPSYSFLIDNELDTASTPAKIRAMQKLGVPYPDGFDKVANEDLIKQATVISLVLKNDSIHVQPTKEIIAMIAYMQRLGVDISKSQTAEVVNK